MGINDMSTACMAVYCGNAEDGRIADVQAQAFTSGYLTIVQTINLSRNV